MGGRRRGMAVVERLAKGQLGEHLQPVADSPGRQRAPAPQQPCAGFLPPSCEPSILFGSL